MIRAITNGSIRLLGSGPGLAIMLGIALVFAVLHLGQRKEESDRLQAEVTEKQETFSRNIAFASGSDNMKSAKGELSKWEDLMENEATRIAALSQVALDAQATIVSLRSRDQKKDSKDGMMRLTHEVESVGLQHQIAAFLDGIYAMEGMASIDGLVLTSEDEGDPDMLVASLELTWYAPSEAEVSTP